ncbi:SKP1-like protein 1A [Glycine soja]|uniref:SKP1-like protein 1A n=1 Tax=Glycine soja TaxID=3848 RepID=A0A445EYU2_GLYSO|nr:SKP1-like protein 1A [Glycine soja]
MALTKNITLKSLDGEAFEVEEAVAVKSQMIKHMIEDNCADNRVPLPNATNKILAEVIKYCKKHVDANCIDEKPSEDELTAWEADFVKGYMLLRLGGLGLYSIIVIDDPPLQLLFVHLCLKEISLGSFHQKAH